MLEEKFPEKEVNRTLDIGYQPVSTVLLFSDITGFLSIVQSCYEKVSMTYRRVQIKKLLTITNWHEHYKDKQTGRRVLSEFPFIEHKHELNTAISLAKMDYDVLFAPSILFNRFGKRFDVFLLKDSFIIKADLKSISSKHPDTINQRIRTGSEQAPYIVIDITSNIDKKDLIEGLRKGAFKNVLLKGILLIYKGKFYRLDKALIMSKKIFTVLK